MTYNDETSELTLNFSELHNIVVGLTSIGPEGAAVNTIKLIPIEDPKVEGDTKAARDLWERKINDLLELMSILDCELHDHFDGCI